MVWPIHATQSVNMANEGVVFSGPTAQIASFSGIRNLIKWHQFLKPPFIIGVNAQYPLFAPSRENLFNDRIQQTLKPQSTL